MGVWAEDGGWHLPALIPMNDLFVINIISVHSHSHSGPWFVVYKEERGRNYAPSKWGWWRTPAAQRAPCTLPAHVSAGDCNSAHVVAEPSEVKVNITVLIIITCAQKHQTATEFRLEAQRNNMVWIISASLHQEAKRPNHRDVRSPSSRAAPHWFILLMSASWEVFWRKRDAGTCPCLVTQGCIVRCMDIFGVTGEMWRKMCVCVCVCACVCVWDCYFAPTPTLPYQTRGSVEEEQDEAAVGVHRSGA